MIVFKCGYRYNGAHTQKQTKSLKDTPHQSVILAALRWLLEL